MNINAQKPAGGDWSGETAKEWEFGAYNEQVTLAESELFAFKAEKFSDGNGEETEYEVYSSAWWDQYPHPSRRVDKTEMSVTSQASVVVFDAGVRIARVEARHELLYYCPIPMDDETFAQFSQNRVMRDVWPELMQLANEALERLELYEYELPAHTSIGPMRFDVAV